MTDEALVSEARQGEEYAAEILLRRCRNIVRRTASDYHLAGADTEDLVQEGMIGVLKAIRDYQPDRGASFRTFAGLCVERQIISAVKGASRLKHSMLNESLSLNRPVTDKDESIGSFEEVIADEKDASPEKMLLLREDVSYISENLNDILSALELQVWKMYVQGSSYKEIAEKLDRTSKGVDNAIQRAKKKLADILES